MVSAFLAGFAIAGFAINKACGSALHPQRNQCSRETDRCSLHCQPNFRAIFKRVMKCTQFFWLAAVSFALLPRVFGQGFINMDFERATIAPTPPDGWTYPADPARCFPGWTVGGAVVMYNTVSLGSPAINLMGPSFPNAARYTPLQGSYSVLLQFFGSPGQVPPTLSQTGFISARARSISFLVSSGISATGAVMMLNGVAIPLVSVSGGRLAGDVSPYAGSVAQLTFSTPGSRGWLYFDDVQFSSSPIPEPSTLRLWVFCIFCLLAGEARARRD